MLKAPFPYFGGKRSVVDMVWSRLGKPRQYIEPFCGSLAMLLGAPRAASLEVVGDQNLYIANFWRCVKYQPDLTWAHQDYPVSHVDLDARHRWLVEPARTATLLGNLRDAEWPGDAKIAGWWVWGMCAWIGSGWCDKAKPADQIPSVTDHRGTLAIGVGGGGQLAQTPHRGNAGMGLQAIGSGARSRTRPTRDGDSSSGGSNVASKIPLVGNAGRGMQSIGRERERERERAGEVASGRSPFCRAPEWGCKRRAAVLRARNCRSGAPARWSGSAC